MRLNSKHLRIASNLAPMALTVGLLFAGGMLFAVLQSVGWSSVSGENHFTARHYDNFVTDAEFKDSLLITFALASVSTLLSATTGLLLALSFRRAAQRWRPVRVLAQVPLAMPHTVMALVVLEFLSPSGILARVLSGVGVIHGSEGFPVLTNDRLGIGIIVAYVLKEAPFVALMVVAVLLRIGDDYDAVARTLGASRWNRLAHVTLPLVAPALVSSSLVVFAFISGAYEVPFLLGRQYPAMLPVVAQHKFMDVDLAVRPDAIAIGVIIAITTAIFVVGYMRLARALSTTERPLIF